MKINYFDDVELITPQSEKYKGIRGKGNKEGRSKSGAR